MRRWPAALAAVILIASAATALADVDVGQTVLLRKQTAASDCARGTVPDRRCSPGAYYSALTNSVICSASFTTDDVRNVPDSEKHAVEQDYGMPAKS